MQRRTDVTASTANEGDREETMRGNMPTRHALGRRGLVAGAAALMAGIVAKQAAQSVAAATEFADRFYASGSTGTAFDAYTNGAFEIGVQVKGSTGGVFGYGDGNTGLGVQGTGSGGSQGVYGIGGSGGAPGVQGDGGGAGAGVYGRGGSSAYGVAGLGGGPNGAGVRGDGQGTGQGVLGVSGTTGVEGLAGGDASHNTTGYPIGVRGSVLNTGYGVYGNTVNGAGIYGIVTGTATAGVYGIAPGGADGVYGQAATGASKGVYGKHTGGGYGVYGEGVNGRGVYGITPSGFGVQGVSTSLYGVVGQSTSNIGVYGQSTSSIGVYGQTSASNQYGILGTTTATNSTAIAGIANTNGSSAFSGGTTNANAYAGVFQGTVVIQGKLVVSDPTYKSGALQHPDGSTRLVYCVESPESWIEDVGTGTLSGGKATVTFDKDFAAVTHTDSYHVFLTEYAETQGLFVSDRSVSGFTVQERNKGTTRSTFSWKVMVKSKSAVKEERLGKFTMPNLPLPDPSKFKPIEALPGALPTKQ